MRYSSILAAYERGDPVGVALPHGGLYGVVGFLADEGGISFMDDAFLDDMPTRHANHHLSGTAQNESGNIVLNGLCFHELEGENALRWRRMFGARNVGSVRRAAEERLRELRKSQ